MRAIHLTVNGFNRTVLVNEHDVLVKVLREDLNLTGTKIGCEKGSCGACTVLVNGIPVQSCISPALKNDGAEIITIEGVGENTKYGRLQELFVSHGSIQCGYCTPGMVMSSIGLLDENKSPNRDEIKEALAGNLCRCTGYKKIIDAVEDFVSEQNETDKKRYKTDELNSPIKKMVGGNHANIEALKKVNGTADYADDIKIKNALHCKFLRSLYPHAKINSIDISSALQIPGVKSIITGKDLPASFGVLPISEDETAMAVGKTRYVGEIVAAVAAESEEIAHQACKAIKVDYSPMKAFFEMEESMKEIEEEEKIHAHVKFRNNIHKKAELRFGDQIDGFEKTDNKLSMEFDFKGVTHGFTEPHAATAYWDENGLTIITATQVPHYLHKYLSKVLEVPTNRIRVIKPYVGGGFGGKSDPFPHEMIISHLARITKRPVKVRFTREEVFLSNHGRHPSKIKMKIGMSDEGELEVMDADIIIDGGAYGSFGVVTTYYNGVLLQAPYKINNFGFRTFRVYTNKPQSGAMRGHGAVNSRFAIESMFDEMAHKLKIDPCALRIKNFIDENSLTVGEYRITSNGSVQSIEKVMEQSGWKEKFNKLPYGHGIGVACGFFISGSALPIHRNEYPQSVVHLKVDIDGRVLITSGASDIGQGSDTMLALIVAEVLGLSLDNIFVVAGDTLLCPIDLGSYSSRVTFMAGNAAKMAAENLRNTIIQSVAKIHNVEETELFLSNEHLFSNDKKLNFTWKETIEMATRKVGALNSSGYYNSPKLGGDFKGSGAGLSPSYSFGAVIAEIKVDTDTGRISVINLWGAHDCGKAINPLSVEGQLEGSWHMGLGQVLSEELDYHEGMLTNADFLNYKIPTSIDTPEIHANIIETNDPEGPFGAKECGEGALHPSMPAVANALFDAVGIRITSLPIKPDDVLKKLKEQTKTNAF